MKKLLVCIVCLVMLWVSVPVLAQQKSFDVGFLYWGWGQEMVDEQDLPDGFELAYKKDNMRSYIKQVGESKFVILSTKDEKFCSGSIVFPTKESYDELTSIIVEEYGEPSSMKEQPNGKTYSWLNNGIYIEMFFNDVHRNGYLRVVNVVIIAE